MSSARRGETEPASPPCIPTEVEVDDQIGIGDGPLQAGPAERYGGKVVDGGPDAGGQGLGALQGAVGYHQRPDALFRQGEDRSSGCTSSAQEHGALAARVESARYPQGGHEAVGIGVVACQTAVLTDDRVHGSNRRRRRVQAVDQSRPRVPLWGTVTLAPRYSPPLSELTFAASRSGCVGHA